MASKNAYAIAVVATVAATAIGYYVVSKKKTKEEPEPTARIFASKDELSSELCAHIVESAKKAITARKKFYLAVAGGSLLDLLSKLADYKDELDFSKVVLVFANHKCVPTDSDKATLLKCKSKFANAAGITTIVAPMEYPAIDSDASTEAEFYAKALKKHVPHSFFGRYPVIDMILLGLGADGHVGSCHPMGPAVAETKKSVAASPKEGEPSSITLTIETMNKAREIGIVVSGGTKGKKEAVKRAMTRPAEEPRGTFPAQLLKSPVFFLDADAAGDL